MWNLLPRLERLGSFQTWRYLTNFWSIIFFLAIIYDFFFGNVLANNNVILAIAAIYGASLAIYSAEKEFRRWKNMHDSMHPGEVYVILWTILILFLIVGETFFDIPYKIPPEVSTAYIVVISILALTRESKNYYKRKKK
jgi:uncharacterized membrane protein YhaH (DUF805 family)